VRIGACSGYGAGFKLHNLFWRFLNFWPQCTLFFPN
jgi:hypothetical protein